MKVIKSVAPAISYICRDKINLLFAVIPVVIGIALFYSFGAAFYDWATAWGDQQVASLLEGSKWGTFINILFKGLLWAIILFSMNFTFVLLVSLIASPFNDLISRRVEKLASNIRPDSMGSSLSEMLKNLVKTLVNETKKILLILFLATIAFLLNFIPVLMPLSILISAILLATQFIDYSWSRHDMSFRDCIHDIRKNIFSYAIAGSAFMVLMSIPIVNLFMLPFGVSYFTTLWVNNKELSV